MKKELTDDLYVVVETGGSIGENASRGSIRVSSIHSTKEAATEARKRMSKMFAGGYFGYHYAVKPISYAKKYCLPKELNINKIKD